MSTRKIWPVVVLAFGVVVSIVGGVCVYAYVIEAIITRVGEPDQSLIFWYLPIFFIGIMGLMGGLGMCAWGIIRLRKIAP